MNSNSSSTTRSSSNGTIWKLLRHPLFIGRILQLPAAVMAVISYPILLLVGAMMGDSGTNKAVAISALLLVAFTVYSGSIVLAFIKWTSWRRLSPALLVFYAACNIAAAVLEPEIAAGFPLFAIAILAQVDINSLSDTMGVAIFAVLCIGIPALGAIVILRHTRHHTGMR